MRYPVAPHHRKFRWRVTLAGLTTVVAGLGIFIAAPPASATTGGGCFTVDPYSSYAVSVSACISAQRNVVYPDGYVTWNFIPPNCSIGLFLQNSSHQNVARGNYACGAHHYGPFSYSVPCLTNWYSEMVVYSGDGNIVATSQAVFVDPGPGGGC
jgi:hypothetical protein